MPDNPDTESARVSDTEVKELRRKRAHIKARLTTFVTFITSMRKFRENIPERTLDTLEKRTDAASGLLDAYEAIQDQIEALVEDLTVELGDRAAFETSFFETTTEASVMLEAARNARDTFDQSNETPPTEIQTMQTTSAPSVVGVKLPTIDLPKFRGNFENWLEYRDTFRSLIHNNPSINKMQRYHYLRASLLDEAAETIAGVDLCEDNYELAWGMVCERYDKSPKLVSQHIRKLFEIKEVKREAPDALKELLDGMNKQLNALTQLGQKTEHWDLMVIHIITTKLDAATIKEWENTRDTDKLPTLGDLRKFLAKRVDILEAVGNNKMRQIEPTKPRPKEGAYPNNRAVRQSYSIVVETCGYCGGTHGIHNCDNFSNLAANDRLNKASECHLCYNCLKKGHSARDCRNYSRCKHCRAKHHTLLHLNREQARGETTPANAEASPQVSSHCALMQHAVLLPTALIVVQDRKGQAKVGRALLDSGSQANFITRSFTEGMMLQREKVNMNVKGIDQGNINIFEKCEVLVKSRNSRYEFSAKCLITEEISKKACAGFQLEEGIKFPPNLKLADPNCLDMGTIDVLIGAEHFHELMCVGQQPLGNHGALMQKSRFGWVVAGPIASLRKRGALHSFHTTNCTDVKRELEQFWHVEGIPETMSSDAAANEHYLKTMHRDESGRFVVRIPFEQSVAKLGSSYEGARHRFLKLERKLVNNPELMKRYSAFINEYIDMDHMAPSQSEKESGYYMPHHCVENEGSITTKLRVVFDASAKASCGSSLNEHQLVGPVIQPELLHILLRFRAYEYIVTADIAKMYRQVKIHPDQYKYQKILWRNSPNDALKTYELNTVTYGTASGSYLAIRCLEQLAVEVEYEEPEVARILRTCFYVDDLIAGFSDIHEAISICNKLIDTLHKGCFPLRKFASNCQEIEEGLRNNITGSVPETHAFDQNEDSKILGLQWSKREDYLFYKINDTKTMKMTKRTILSDIASIFDPLGLIAPCVIRAKLLMQKLWREGLTWDEAIPAPLATEWELFKGGLKHLSKIRIPRVVLASVRGDITMHGFCDASQVAYGAAIYLVSHDNEGRNSRLLCARTRVAPKGQVSIPRLELCAATLLSRLVGIVRGVFPFELKSTVLWTDSMVVLGWLRSTESHKLPVFVKNRVLEINGATHDCEWRHVPTQDNPADVLSRGVAPRRLKNNWWSGPDWLGDPPSAWPIQNCANYGMENDTIASYIVKNPSDLKANDIFPINRISSFRTLTHVAAYCLRFIKNARVKDERAPSVLLTVEELENGLYALIRQEQHKYYHHVIEAERRGNYIQNEIASLGPFLDKDLRLLRVGGRLRKSSLTFAQRHPIILPPKSDLVLLMIRTEHIRLLHAGPQATLHSMRVRYWVPTGRSLTRKVVNGCVICRRCRPNMPQPKMGELPGYRVTPALPFLHCGVDFAGPYMLKTFAGRGAKCYKAYVALFVCMVTRAVHIELVTSLSSDAFLACLRRFAARRGRPSDIYSDNATNFHGADNELKRYVSEHNGDLEKTALELHIKWHFTPALSPNFGGLWEAGVKSVKHHLTRVLFDRKLTYEEMITLLYQIEGILNSRPISPISTDPNDDPPLTPAHFLIGRTMTSIPTEGGLDSVPEGRLATLQRIQAALQGFWKRWSADYVNQQVQRNKWLKSKGFKPEVGLLVLLQGPDQPYSWKWGRIEQLHPGDDGIVRVVTIRTSTGSVKRAISKIAPLLADS